jgi:hypothetical protein
LNPSLKPYKYLWKIKVEEQQRREKEERGR